MTLLELGRTVKQAQHRQHRALDVALGSVGTTVVQWDALRAIGRIPGASAHQLAMETFQTDQAFGTLAQRLLVQGKITRKSGEGRRLEHELTPLGKNILAQADGVIAAVLTDLFAPLSQEEKQTLQVILTKLLA